MIHNYCADTFLLGGGYALLRMQLKVLHASHNIRSRHFVTGIIVLLCRSRVKRGSC